MERINLAELLKDCIGMELDCAIFDDIVLSGVDDKDFPIQVKTKGGYVIRLTKYGTYSDVPEAKCLIFPKGKTTWEGFTPPCQFKDGDILSYQCAGLRNRTIYIYRDHPTMNTSYYVALGGDLDFMVNHKDGYNTSTRLATEEEKEKLFQAIKDKGYRWNPEIKTLEKLVTIFKVGDEIKLKDAYAKKYDDFNIREVTDILDSYYILDDENTMPLANQYLYELVSTSTKFDIDTLVPFESKVLVRNDENQFWIPAFWGTQRVDGYTTTFGWCKYCIPYEGNEHLLETNDDCDEYFKTWKKLGN